MENILLETYQNDKETYKFPMQETHQKPLQDISPITGKGPQSPVDELECWVQEEC